MIGLATLRNTTVRVLAHDAYPEKGQASIVLTFSDGTSLTTAYWRLIENGQATRSSFDHDQQYGLPAPIDAKAELAKALDHHTCLDAKLDEVTGDLLFAFDRNLQFQALNFTSYEVWTIIFPDRTGEYSNYALANITRRH